MNTQRAVEHSKCVPIPGHERLASHHRAHQQGQRTTNMSGHSAGSSERCPVLPGRSKHSPESTSGQLPGQRGIMGGSAPEPGSHPGKPTPGSESRNPTHCDPDPATHNTTSASSTPCVEKPCKADQHQCPISPLRTSAGKPATPKPETNAPTTETPGGTQDAGNEAAAGAAQAPRVPKASSLRASSRTRRKSPLYTTRIGSRTSFGPTIRTTQTASPAPPLSVAT